MILKQDLNFNQYQGVELCLERLASNPLNPKEGRIYFNTLTGEIRAYGKHSGWASYANVGNLMTLNTTQEITGAKTFGVDTFYLEDAGTGFDIKINSTSGLTGNKTLTFNLDNGHRSLSITANASIAGTNTGDETRTRINSLAITTVGVIDVGTWNGDAIKEAYLENQSGTNSGDQASIVGISGSMVEFNAALSDGNFAYLAAMQSALDNKEPLTVLVAKSANYTATASDSIIDCNGTFTVTFYTAIGNKSKRITVKNSGTGTITEVGDGAETLEGELTQSISSGDSHTWVSDGANWKII